MKDAVKLYDETAPNWLRTICPIETPREKYRRIEKEIKDLDRAEKNAREAFSDRMEEIHDRQLFLMDQRLKAIDEIEASGDEL